MKETINMNVDKELVETVNVIQTLKDCGVISVTNELSCMGNLWKKLTDGDKQFILGMIRGSAVALANKADYSNNIG